MNLSKTTIAATSLAMLAASAGAQQSAYIIEGSGFFGVPGITIGALAEIDLADPSNVTPLGVVAPDLRFGGVDTRPGSSDTVAFENSTNSLRMLDTSGTGGYTLIDSVGYHESGTAGLTFSNDGSIAYTTTSVSAFGRIVEADAHTGEVLTVHNIVGPTLSSLATVPEGHPTYEPGEIWGLGLTSIGILYLYQLDLDTDSVFSQTAITGIGFNPQFETGLDWAPDGTLYALIQGFRQLGPDEFEEISAHLYTINPDTGAATLIGVVQGQGTWDAVGLALKLESENPGCNTADLAAPYDVLNFADVQTFLGAFGQGLPSADLAAPMGTFNFADVQAFLGAFGAGCPS